MIYSSHNLNAEESTSLRPPLLDPNEVVDIAWKYIVDNGLDIDRFKYRIEVVFFSYTKRKWIVAFGGELPIGGDFYLNIEDSHNPQIRGVGGA